MNVLLGVDDSSCSNAAIHHVLSFPWPKGTRFLVVSAVAPIFIGSDEGTANDAIGRLLEEQKKYHGEIAQLAAERIRKGGLDVESRVVVGDPRSALMDAARSAQADLVVVGSHGRTGVKKLLLGSVASYVVNHAPCSVLVVREAGGHHA